MLPLSKCTEQTIYTGKPALLCNLIPTHKKQMISAGVHQYSCIYTSGFCQHSTLSTNPIVSQPTYAVNSKELQGIPQLKSFSTINELKCKAVMLQFG